MEDPFSFWSNVSMEQDIGGGGRRRYDIQGQEQEMMKWKSMMEIDGVHHQNTTVTTTKKTKGKKGGGTLPRKPEKKTPKRGVGIAKLEETIKQKNSQLPAADRPVYHGFPTTSVASVLPTTYNDNQSHQIQFHHLPPFLHHQQQKQTGTVSSSSVDFHGNNKHNIIDGGHLNLNRVPNNDGGYDQISMNYGSGINVNKGGHGHRLMNTSHDHQQFNGLLHPSKQQHWNSTYNGAGYNPSSGSGVCDDQHGNTNLCAAAGFYSPKVVELSSTQKQQHYHDHLSQHSDHIGLNNQKNLNNGENIGGFTRYSQSTSINAQILDRESADFLELDLGRKWNNNVNGRQIKKDFTSSSKAAGAGYSGLTNDNVDQVELLAVHRKGKSSSSSSNILMEYEFLSLTNGGIKDNHQFHTNGGIIKKKNEPHYYSSNYSSSSSCVMEESAASSSAVRKGSDLISSSQSNRDHEFLDLSLKLSSYH